MSDPKNKFKKSQYVQYPPVEISTNDFTEIIFSDIEGYIIGSEENPVTATSMSIDLTEAKPGTEVLIFHSSSTKPSFDAGDSVSIFRELGSYISSVVNPISLLYIASNKVMIIYGNESGAITDGVDLSSAGIIAFDSPTQVDISGFQWRKNGILNQSGTVNDLTIPGTPTTYDRIDILEGGSANDVYWKQGSEAEDQPFPAITTGRVLLATIARNLAGGNTIEIEPSQLQDLLSKTQTGIQTIESNLAIKPLAGTIRNSLFPDENGALRKTRTDYHGVYSTVEGQTGWSRLVKIDATDNQIDFFCMLEFAGISSNFEKGMIWINFSLNPDGSMLSNKSKVFGEVNKDKFTIVRTNTFIYELFVNHDEPASFYKFRPQFSFGTSEKYTYYHQDGKGSLPAGLQYSLSKLGPLEDDVVVDNSSRKAMSGLNQKETNDSIDLRLLDSAKTGVRWWGGWSDQGGGVIRRNAGAGSVFNHADKDNLIYTPDIEWDQLDIDLSATDDLYFISVLSDGTSEVSTTEPNHSDYRTKIPLLRVSIRGGVVSGASEIGMPFYNETAQLWDLFKKEGISHRSLEILDNAIADLSFRVNAGEIYQAGIRTSVPLSPHEISYEAQNIVTFRHVFRGNTQTADRTLLDFANYDNGGEVTTAVPLPNTNATIQLVFAFPSDPMNIRVLYGQSVFASMNEAIAAIGSTYFPIIPETFSNAVLLGYIVGTRDVVSSANTSKIRFFSNNYRGGINATPVVTPVSNYKFSITTDIEYEPTGTAFDSVTYNRGGAYTRVGKIGILEFNIRTSSLTKGSASGDVRINIPSGTNLFNEIYDSVGASFKISTSQAIHINYNSGLAWASNPPNRCTQFTYSGAKLYLSIDRLTDVFDVDSGTITAVADMSEAANGNYLKVVMLVTYP